MDEFFDNDIVVEDTGEEEAKPATSRLTSLHYLSKLPISNRIVILTGVYITFFAGAVLGWGPMQLMHESNGAFSYKCSDEEVMNGVICEQQMNSLLRIPLISGMVSILSPVLGHVADRYGSDILMHGLGMFGIAGISLVMVASATGTDWILFVAFTFLYLMFYSGSIMITKTGLLFDGHSRRRVISVLNSLLDAGSMTYLILLMILQGVKATVVQVMGGYLGVAVLCFGTSSYLWVKMCKSLESSLEGERSRSSIAESESRGQDTDGENECIDTIDQEMKTVDGCTCQCCPNSNYKLVRRRNGAKEQLQSELYILLLIFFVFNESRSSFVLATARDCLAHLGDDATGNKYLSIFTFLTTASVLGQPAIDYVLKKYGYGVGLQVVTLLGLIHGIIQLSSADLNVQIVGFVAFSFYRGFLFSVIFSFVATFLAGDVIGKGAGLLNAISAVFKCINLPLANWAVTNGGNFFWPNFIYTVGLLPCFVMSWKMGKIGQQEKEVEQFVCFNCQVKLETTVVTLSRRVSITRRPSIEPLDSNSVPMVTQNDP